MSAPPASEPLAGYPVVVRIPVAWGDMDALGHVNNVVYQNAPQCSACNGEAVQGVVKRRYRPQGGHSGLSCCSMYCLSTDSGAPPTVRMQ